MSFSYRMIVKEIEQLFMSATQTKTAAYEAMTQANTGSEQMAQAKLSDLEATIKTMQIQLKELHAKIEYIKTQP
jgi:enoyl-[acyl-carrier-protein] reductase (NADH)